MINLADVFERAADAVPDRLALVAGEVRLTYRELDERANRWRTGSRSKGYGRASTWASCPGTARNGWRA